MKPVIILSDDAPYGAYYGHPKGVQGWEDVSDIKASKDGSREFQRKMQTLKGALIADHKADSRGRRYIRLHGIGVGIIRKDKRTNGQELRLFKEFTASGKEEKTACKSISECLAVAGAKL